MFRLVRASHCTACSRCLRIPTGIAPYSINFCTQRNKSNQSKIEEVHPSTIDANTISPNHNQNKDTESYQRITSNENLFGSSIESLNDFAYEDSHKEPLSHQGKNTNSTNGNDTFASDNDFKLLNDFISEEYQAKSENKENQDFDDLMKSLNISENFNESTSGSLEAISDLTVNNLKGDFSPVDIDKNDETIFDLDFLNDDNKSSITKKLHEEEKQLFQNIFNAYVPSANDEADQRKKSFSLKDTLGSAQTLTIKNSRNELDNVSLSFKNQMFSKSKEALAPTLKYIDDFSTTMEIVDYFDFITKQWSITINDNSNVDKIYLNKLLKNSSQMTTNHETFLKEMLQSSQESPKLPLLNVITFPLIFNQILKTVAYKFNDGQLAISLFNLSKKDLHLYSNICNQDTYNELIKLHWIYYGKSNLYNVEMIYLEMTNNGFGGDLKTFNILKQIVVDYFQLKMGKSQINKKTGLPIWSREDERRIKYFEWKLHNLGNGLKSMNPL